MSNKSFLSARSKATSKGALAASKNAGKAQTTNVIRGVFIGVLAAVVAFASVALLSRKEFAEIGVDGQMMPAGVGVEAKLRSDSATPIELIDVEAEDTVLSMLGIYYLGGQRGTVDINFPIWMNNGTSLKFISEDITLIADSLDEEQTFDGLIISDGTTYTEDLVQADWENFIFVRLPNGLIMNVQDMKVKTPGGTIRIPSNSILMMTQGYFTYYVWDSSCLAFKTVYPFSNEMTVIFGEIEFDYYDLLIKLGLLHQEEQESREESSDISASENESKEGSNSIVESQDNSQGDNSDPSKEKDESQNQGSKTADSEGGSGNPRKPDGGESGESGQGSQGGQKESEKESGKESSGSQSGKEGESGSSHESESETSGEPEGESGQTSGESGQTSGESEGGSGQESEDSEHSQTQESEGSKSESDESGSESEESDESQSGDSEDSEDDSHDPESSEDEEDEDSNEESNSGSGSGSSGGSGGKSAYRSPVVSVSDFEAWCYAVNLNLTVNDRSHAIMGGVKITIWSRLENGHYSGITTEDGIRVFTATKGKGAVLRRTYSATDEITLSTVPPDSTIYIQFTYRYSYESEEIVEGQKVTVTSRRSYSSDFYEINTLPINDTNLQKLNVNFETLFATSDTGFTLNDFVLTNASSYNSKLDTFANFKLNSLPYINRLELRLTKIEERGVEVKNAKAVVIKFSTIFINSAKDTVTIYKSANGVLEPDCVYTFTVVATDKYSNELAINVNGNTTNNYMGTMYTSKSAPKVEMKVLSNVTDLLTLQITVKDTYGALLPSDVAGKNQDIYLMANETTGNKISSIISGKFDDGSSFSSDIANRLYLENPQDGKVYTYPINSLAFAQSYLFTVYGNYSLQPTSASETKLSDYTNSSIGTAKAYTASLSSGLISFASTFENLTDTKIDISIEMTNKTTTDILPIVDEFRFIIRKTGYEEKYLNFILSEAIHNDETKTWTYDHDLNGLILQAGDALTPKVVLLGEESTFNSMTPWEAFMISMEVNETTGQKTYSVPAILKIYLPDDTLSTSVNYTFSVESMVLKGGREYSIPTNVTNTAFKTRKIAPKIIYDTLFVAGNVIEFINFKIYDPDNTISNNGFMYANLYYNGSLLSYNEIYATTDKDAQGVGLRFEDLILGGEYFIKLVAPGYNDADGMSEYQINYTSKTDPKWTQYVTAGSNLYADMSLTDMDYSTVEDNCVDFIDLSGAEVAEKIKKTKNGELTGYAAWAMYDSTRRCTEYFEIPDEYNFLEVVDYFPEKLVNNTTVFARFYTDTYSYIGYKSVTYSLTTGYDNPAFFIPTNAKYFNLVFNATDEELSRIGLHIRAYTIEAVDLMHDESTADYLVSGKTISAGKLSSANANYRVLYQIPVHPGDVYITGSNTGGMWYYAENKEYRYSPSNPQDNHIFVIPEDVYFMSYVASSKDANAGLWKVADADSDAGYTATFEADIVDLKAYLAKIGTPYLTMEVYRALTEKEAEYPESFNEIEASESLSESESYSNLTEYDLEDYSQGELCYRFKVYLTELEDGTWSYVDNNKTITIKNLAANSSYKFVLSCDYLGSKVVLDTETLKTDGRYIIVDSERDLYRISFAPYSNYYVTKDIRVANSFNVTLYGTIDFNGHRITMAKNSNNFLFSSNYGEIYNLVFEIENYNTEGNIITATKSVCHYNYQIIKNVIIKTHGDVVCKTSYPLAVYQNNGQISNVFVELNGDAYVTGDRALVFGYNDGLIENVMMYGKNGAGVILDGAQTSGFMYYNYHIYSTLRNVVTIFDMWFYNSTGGATDDSLLYYNYIGASLQHWYHVGDFYNWTGKKVKLSPSAKQRMINGTHSNNLYTNHWYLISNSNYTSMVGDMKKKDASALRDINWQKEQLGSGFEVEKTVSMGYYPRIKFPNCMQKEQPYLALPSQNLSDVALATDGWTQGDNAYIGNEMGNISLYFNNPTLATISNIKIDGLTIVSILQQRALNDGSDLYQVVLSVKATKFTNSYTVKSYDVSQGANIVTVSPNYQTTGFSFWKEINDAAGWAEINTNMGWNYKLMSDIDFSASNLTQASIMINGSKTDVSKTTTFSGALDGNGHTLSHIHFENTRYPYVFYNIEGKYATIKNLFVDDMILTANNLAGSICAFVRSSSTNFVIENVHMSNCVVKGGGKLGIIMGTTNYGFFRGCGTTDCVIEDIFGTETIYAGTIIAYGSRVDISRSWATGFSITISLSKASGGIGGVVGYYEYSAPSYCYAQGSIVSCADYVGGLVGYAGTNNLRYCIADVVIKSSGSYVGVLNGFGLTSTTFPQFAAGSVSCTGDKINRLFGNSTNQSRTKFAYLKQPVTGLSVGELGDAGAFVSSKALQSINTWTDYMCFGSYYDYASVAEGYYPKLVDDDGNIYPGQVDIPLPGLGGEPVLTLSKTVVDPNTDTYSVALLLEHPGYTYNQIKALIENNKLRMTVDGIDVSETAIDDGYVSVIHGFGAEDNTTQFLIEITDADKAFLERKDTYKVVMNITFEKKSFELECSFGFDGVNLAWIIESVSDWNSLMPTHGYNNENFIIKGTIDFAQASTSITNLNLGRLEGTNNACIKGLHFVSDEDGTPWMERVMKPITNIRFEDIQCDFSGVTKARGITGLILLTTGIENCDFENIHLYMNASNTKTNCGLFYKVNGKVNNVTVHNASMQVLDAKGKVQQLSYTSSAVFVVQVVEQLNNSTFSDMVMYSASSTCGVVCSRVEVSTNNCTFERLKQMNCGNECGIISVSNKTTNCVFTDCYVDCGVYSSCAMIRLCRVASGLTFNNCEVYCKYNGTRVSHVGMFTAYAWSLSATNLKFYNCKITTTNTRTGMVMGYTYTTGTATIKDVVVDGCTITCNGTNSKLGKVGALVGDSTEGPISCTNCVIRDTVLTNYGAIGGITSGVLDSKLFTATNCYIAEDVKMYSTAGVVGGLVGSTSLISITNCAVGATLESGAAIGVGGFVGSFNPVTANPTFTIKNSYFNGSMTAPDYVGGLIGYISNNSIKASKDNFTGLVIAGNITCLGKKVSTWMNNSATSGAPGDALTYVYESMLINGQTVKGLVDSNNQAQLSAYYVADSSTFVTAEDLATTTKWQAWGFTTKCWSFGHFGDDNLYMPYVFHATNTTTILPFSNEKLKFTDLEDGVNGRTFDPQNMVKIKAGILLPEKGGDGETVLVYASTVDSINIEFTPNTLMTINGKSYVTNSNGIITYAYDFVTPITINGIEYQPSQLQRLVMTKDDYWYYVATDGTIHCGTEAETDTPNIVTATGSGFEEGAVPVHMWGGYVMFDNGRIYQIIEQEATLYDTFAGMSTRDDMPLYSYLTTVGNRSNVRVDVYARFTLFDATRVEHQVFSQTEYDQNNKSSLVLYTVSPYLNKMPDGVFLIRVPSTKGDLRYFLLLGQDGVLTSNMDTAVLGAFDIDDISYIASSFYSTGKILMAKYEDGSIMAVNVATGETIVDTRVGIERFLGAIENGWRTIFKDPGPNFVYSYSELSAEERYDESLEGIIGPGGESKEESQESSSGSGGSGIQDPDGKEGKQSEGGEVNPGDKPADNPGTEDDTVKIYYSAEKGIYTDTEILVKPEQIKVEGDDLIVDGKAQYTVKKESKDKPYDGQEDTPSGDEGGSEEGGDGKGSETGSHTAYIEVRELATFTLDEIFGDTIALCNAETGEYENVSLEKLNSDGTKKTEEKLVDKKTDEKEEAPENLIDKITITWNAMSTQQKSGFVTISILAIVILAAIIFVVVRLAKKKKQD